jgi:hypothetical protein
LPSNSTYYTVTTRHGISVIVLGARPHHGSLARTILGSVSDPVVTTSTIPCLVVRRGGVAAVAGVEVAAGPGAAPEAGTARDVEHADVRGVTRAMQAADIAAAVSSSRRAGGGASQEARNPNPRAPLPPLTGPVAAANYANATPAAYATDAADHLRRNPRARGILYRRGPGGMEEALHAFKSGAGVRAAEGGTGGEEREVDAAEAAGEEETERRSPPPPTSAPPLPSGRRIAIAVDGSDASRRMVGLYKMTPADP